MILLENNFSVVIEEGNNPDGKKNLYLQGIFMESERKNRNLRTYRRTEIEKAVQKINEAASQGRHILGELDHPNGTLEVKLENVSHKIISMHMDGNNAIGKAQIIESVPKGQIAKGLIEAGVQLGVSSRGSGMVDEDSGIVENFDVVTVDIVANPSAIDAYPQSITESLYLYRKGKLVESLAEAVIHDEAAQKYFEKEIMKFIKEAYNK